VAVVFIDKDDGQYELIALIEGVEHLVAGDGDRGRPFDTPLDLDVSRVRLFVIDGGWVRGQIPAALVG